MFILVRYSKELLFTLYFLGLVDKEKSKKSPGSLPEKSLNLLRGKSTSNVRSKASSPVNPPSSQVSKSSAVISSPTTPPEESQFQVQNEEEQYEHRDMHGENEDNFVSVNTKHEDSELGMDDQFEATEHWNEVSRECVLLRNKLIYFWFYQNTGGR